MTEQTALSILETRATARKTALVATGTYVLALLAGESYEINAHGGLYLLTDVPLGVSVESEQGSYHLGNVKVRVHSEEHSGLIAVKNTTNDPVVTRWVYGIFIE